MNTRDWDTSSNLDTGYSREAQKVSPGWYFYRGFNIKIGNGGRWHITDHVGAWNEALMSELSLQTAMYKIDQFRTSGKDAKEMFCCNCMSQRVMLAVSGSARDKCLDCKAPTYVIRDSQPLGE